MPISLSKDAFAAISEVQLDPVQVQSELFEDFGQMFLIKMSNS